MKNIIKDLVPPLMWRAASRTKHLRVRSERIRSNEGDQLFNGDSDIFTNAIRDAKVYGEYGVGQSTIWVRNNTNLEMICVDSDKKWIGMVREKIDRSNNIQLVHVDLGTLSEWGRPRGYANRERFLGYSAALWQAESTPDTVLIDGRFRVSCFLTSVLRGAPGTKIVFDDYVGRPEYSIVEEVLLPAEVDKRQALFVVPPKIEIDTEKLEELLQSFALVTE